MALIFADPKYKAIFLVWRGTEPFNTWDWSTDIDFSFAKFKNGMAVHVGFLEALGLCCRGHVDSFIEMDNIAQQKRNEHKNRKAILRTRLIQVEASSSSQSTPEVRLPKVHQDLLFVLPPSPPKKKALKNICVMSFVHVLRIVPSIMTRCFSCF